MSSSLYNTFGNELDYTITRDTIVAYLKNATIKFPIPEASSTLLSELADPGSINQVEFEAVKAKLESIGFGEPNARTMAVVLLQVADSEGVDPMTYFDLNNTSIKFAADTYKTINLMRPPGNQIGLANPRINRRSQVYQLIKP